MMGNSKKFDDATGQPGAKLPDPEITRRFTPDTPPPEDLDSELNGALKYNTEAKRKQDIANAAREAERAKKVGRPLSEDASDMIRKDLKAAAKLARRAMRKAIKTGSAANIGLSPIGEQDDLEFKELSLEHRLLAVRVNKPLKSNRDLPLQPAIMAEFDESNHGSRHEKQYLTENERKYFGETEPADYVDEAGMKAGHDAIMTAYRKGKPLVPEV